MIRKKEAIEDSRRIDQICSRFESSWHAETPLSIEEVLESHDAELRQPLLKELVAVELELRYRGCEDPRLDDYQARFADSSTLIEEVFTAVQRELRSESPLPADRFQYLGEIARGGMGVVVRVQENNLGRKLAAKLLQDKYAEQPEAHQRFLTEARICAQLQHPGVVSVHELGTLDDGRPFFTMKLVEGQTLATLLAQRKNSRQDRRRLLNIFLQASQAVAYAHSCGVIHRDLKPSNIMVGSFGEVQVMDWGLAKRMVEAERPPSAGADVQDGSTHGRNDHPTTQCGSVMGTPAYMPPEQARGEMDDVDARSDVFALGAILCEILTGTPPYTGQTTTAIHQYARRAALSDAHGRLDQCMDVQELCELARHCLAADRDERPADATAIADAISSHFDSVTERLREAELITARGEARQSEEHKRRRLVWLIAAGVICILVSGLWSAAWYQDQRAHQQQEAMAVLDEAQQLYTLAAESTEASPRVWHQARQKAERAATLFEELGNPSSSSAAVQKLIADLDLCTTLDEIAQKETEVDTKENRYADEKTRPEYQQAFRNFGISPSVPASQSAETIRSKPPRVRVKLLYALDRWLRFTSLDDPERAWLAQVIEDADSDPWRHAVRDTIKNNDLDSLRDLAQDVDVAQQPAFMLVNVGQSLIEYGQPDQAERLWRRAQFEHSGDFWINHHLGMLVDDTDIFDSVRFLAVAATIRKSAGSYLNVGLRLARRKRNEDAALAFRHAIKLRPDYTQAYCSLGNVQQELGKPDLAEENYRMAIQVGPEDVNGYLAMGRFLSDRGDFATALKHIEKAIELNPDRGEAHFGRGVIKSKLKNWSEAAESFRRAAELDPGRPEPWMRLGLMSMHMEDYDQAEVLFHQVIRLRPELAEVHCNLGHLLTRQGRFSEALVAYRRGHKLAQEYESWKYPSGKWVIQADELAKLEAEFNRFTSGEEEVSDPNKCVELALRICPAKQLHETALKLLEQALAAKHQLTPAALEGVEYRAAVCALAIADGRDLHLGSVDPVQQNHYRERALAWLDSSLDRIRIRLLEDPQKHGDSVKKLLEHWRHDRGLETIRQPDTLSVLPAKQREASQRFWSSVDLILALADSE